MKYKYFKTLAIILIGIISFSITTDVSAETKEKIHVSLTNHGNIRNVDPNNPTLNTRMATTHIMTVKINGVGEEKAVYCAWYENDAPASKDYDLVPIDIDNKAIAAGLYSILSADLKNYGLSKYNAYTERVIKTTAINLFLSLKGEMAGKKCGSDSNRFDGMNWSSDFYNANKYSFEGLNNIYTTFVNSTNKYEKAAGLLVQNANSVVDNYKQPSISLKNNDNEYVLQKGYYVKKYELTTVNVNTKTLTAEVEGLTENEKKQVAFVPNGNSITVKIPKDVYENLEDRKITVVVNAEATYGVAKIYALEQNRCRFQDLVFPVYELNKMKVSTKDVLKLKECRRYVTKCDSTTCGDSKTTRKCESSTEVYYATTCDVNDTGVNIDGKLTYSSGPCTLYCTEEAVVDYPGNYLSPVNVYGNFIWPAKEGFYSLKTTSTLTCKMSSGACKLQTKDIKYINNTGGKLTYTGPKNQETTILLDQKCQTTEPVIDETNMTLEIVSNCSYTLPETKNIAVNKKTLDYIDTSKITQIEDTFNNVFIKDYKGVLSINGISTWNDELISNIDFSKRYDLQISELPVGHNGQFTSTLDKSAYVCQYKLTTDVSGVCTCPPESEYAGLDLYDLQMNYTCAEAQIKFCYGIIPPGEDPYCLDKDTNEKKYYKDCSLDRNSPDYSDEKCKEELNCIGDSDKGLCPPESKHPNRDYKSCVFGGMSEADCIQLICYDDSCTDNCDYVCPEKSDYPNKDISNCVNFERGKGNNLENSISVCQKRYCYKGGNGIIIYRTISLENPFPSMDADKNITQKDLTVGMFNDTVKGRYPGTNWNGITLVKNKILNNRGYDGSAIYQEADPLYVIELDATAIKKIRDYNSYQVEHSEGYADFTLTCTNGAYCRSSFLRDGRYTKADGKQILTGGTCQSVDGKDSFVNCYSYNTKKG